MAQNELVVEILKRLSREGVLDRALLIGSWGAYFYKYFFKGKEYHPILKTRDIDFLVSRPVYFKKKVDLQKLLADLGFEIVHFSNGIMKLENAELILELLIPEMGAGRDKPYPLPDLNFNAQPLRHLSMLWREPIEVDVDGVPLKLPHPADYCLHKLIIQSKRKKADKKEKDLESAFSVLESLLREKRTDSILNAFQKLFPKEKKKVLETLIKGGYEELATRLKS